MGGGGGVKIKLRIYTNKRGTNISGGGGGGGGVKIKLKAYTIKRGTNINGSGGGSEIKLRVQIKRGEGGWVLLTQPVVYGCQFWYIQLPRHGYW